MKLEDEVFDRTFVVRADEPDEARTLLRPDVRQALLRFVSIDPTSFHVTGQAGTLHVFWSPNRHEFQQLDSALELVRSVLTR